MWFNAFPYSQILIRFNSVCASGSSCTAVFSDCSSCLIKPIKIVPLLQICVPRQTLHLCCSRYRVSTPSGSPDSGCFVVILARIEGVRIEVVFQGDKPHKALQCWNWHVISQVSVLGPSEPVSRSLQIRHNATPGINPWCHSKMLWTVLKGGFLRIYFLGGGEKKEVSGRGKTPQSIAVDLQSV